jgi:uncharacterized protein YukE
MSQAIVDPQELRRFAAFLRRFNDDLRRQLTATQTQLQNLTTTWRDQEQQKFADEFGQQMASLGGFMETVDEYVRFLLRKAEKAEEYLEQK